jgi:diacylglycerol O-acyltransferase / wax synthase
MSAQRMKNADAAWLHMDRRTNLMVVNAVLWFDEPLDLERARDVLRVRFIEPFSRFRQRIVEPRVGLGVPSWQDDPNFDLGRHIHHIALPAPGDKAALEELVGDVMVTPLDRSRPLWDIYLIDGYGSGMAMMFRFHHCIADGIALSRILLSLTDAMADAGIEPARDGASRRGRIGALAAPVKAGVQLAGAGLHGWIEILAHPATELTALASRGSAEARALAKLLTTGTDTKTVLSGKLGVTRRVTWSEPILSRTSRRSVRRPERRSTTFSSRR